MRRRYEPSVVFPWERRRSRLAGFSRRNTRAGLVVAVVLLALWGLVQADADRRARFATRAEIANVMRAVESYRADHDGHCPAGTGALVAPGDGREAYLSHEPRDGWGEAMRMQCPGRKHAETADVVSSGPMRRFDDRDTIE